MCKHCFKPINYSRALVCNECSRRIKADGFNHHRVRLGSVGANTTPYQQHLHTKFFKCNAPVEYRGTKANRVYNSLESKHILSHVSPFNNRLNQLLPKNMLWLYNQVRHLRNFNLRLIYNITLYHIDYHILRSSHYNNEEHFTSSMVQTLFNHILTSYCRTNRDWLKDPVKKRFVKRATTEKVDINQKRYDGIVDLCREVGSDIVSQGYS